MSFPIAGTESARTGLQKYADETAAFYSGNVFSISKFNLRQKFFAQN